MMRQDTLQRPLAVSLKLQSAQDDLKSGRLTHALQYFAYVEDELQARPELGPEDTALFRAMLQAAQYGVTASLLSMRRISEAKRAATLALEGSFARQEGDPVDRRRYFLTVVSSAKTREDYARAWAHLLELR